jgi:multicomponent Na+:H+ antiporter subunit F
MMILIEGPVTVLTVAASISLTLVMISIVLAFVRVLRGPSLPDRVMGLDMIGVMAVSVIVLTAIVSGEAVLIDAAIALALVAFLGTLAFARFIERRERSDDE